ncbi:unnamed protein product [Angiostrongylus costaricensis]|uniref:Rab-GAP TBC domain-containing protein n=1 Tax=Angiostrongylus costaricensis TaxID=334426 RepID=A0A158PK68_ANGCS|nr:unnamed protein product [Angiostrongylus costaricensis]
MMMAHYTGPPGGKVDDLGFESPWSDERNLDGDEQVMAAKREYTKFWADYFPVVMRRRKRWEHTDPRRDPSKLQRFVYKGIPAPFRKEVSMLTLVNVLSIHHEDLDEKLCTTRFATIDNGADGNGGSDSYRLAKNFPQQPVSANRTGINFVAGLILLVMKNETNAVDLLIQMVRQRQDYYNETMSGLKRDTRVLQLILA